MPPQRRCATRSKIGIVSTRCSPRSRPGERDVLIDTHCHLDEANCAAGPDAALERARAVGVGGFIAIGVGSIAAAREVLALSARVPDVACTTGVHPHDASALDDAL